MQINKVFKKDLSDLDIDQLPDGFAIIFDDRNKPIGALLRYDYYQYITKLIAKVKKYILHAKTQDKSQSQT